MHESGKLTLDIQNTSDSQILDCFHKQRSALPKEIHTSSSNRVRGKDEQTHSIFGDTEFVQYLVLVLTAFLNVIRRAFSHLLNQRQCMRGEVKDISSIQIHGL